MPKLISSQERLLQDISHELRSPIARLHIAIELGRNKTKRLADKEFNRMELECNRLNALISELLDFTRLEQPSSDQCFVKTDLHEIISAVIEDANYEFGNKRVEIKAMEPCTLLIDPRLIHRAVENIIRNALHYSPLHEKVFVYLYYNENKTQVYIDIKDNGPGVPEAQLGKIFNPFYRVDTSRTKKTGGYGLGLAIASRAISLHSGEIVAFNNEDGGLLVRIRLPAVTRNPITETRLGF